MANKRAGVKRSVVKNRNSKIVEKKPSGDRFIGFNFRN